MNMIKNASIPGSWQIVKDWAMKQKRITNRMIREGFDLDEDDADVVYMALKKEGIIESMGYVATARPDAP